MTQALENQKRQLRHLVTDIISYAWDNDDIDSEQRSDFVDDILEIVAVSPDEGEQQ